MISPPLTLGDIRRLVEELADELFGADYRRARNVLDAIDLYAEQQKLSERRRVDEKFDVYRRQHRDMGDEREDV